MQTEYLLCAPESDILPLFSFRRIMSASWLWKGRIGDTGMPPVRCLRVEMLYEEKGVIYRGLIVMAPGVSV